MYLAAAVVSFLLVGIVIVSCLHCIIYTAYHNRLPPLAVEAAPTKEDVGTNKICA